MGPQHPEEQQQQQQEEGGGARSHDRWWVVDQCLDFLSAQLQQKPHGGVTEGEGPGQEDEDEAGQQQQWVGADRALLHGASSSFSRPPGQGTPSPGDEGGLDDKEEEEEGERAAAAARGAEEEEGAEEGEMRPKQGSENEGGREGSSGSGLPLVLS